jgi:predicted MFS family arabinose efflux permease
MPGREAGSAAEPARPWRIAVGGLLALAAAMGIGRFVYTPILPAMAEALPLTKGEAGLIASANFAGYLAGALLAATPWVSGSRRAWLLGGLALSAGTTALSGTLSGLLALAAVRFTAGMASAFVLVFASSLVLDRLAAAGESRLSAVHFAGVGTGIALAALAVSALAAVGGDWRAQWLVSGGLALLALPAVAALLPADAPAGPVARRPPPLALTPRLGAFVAAYGLFGFGYVITATFLVAIVRDAPALRHVEALVWIVVGLAAAPSVGLWTALGRRIGVPGAFALACLVEAAGVALSVLATGTAGILLSAAFLGGTFMGLTALGLVGARALSASDPRRVLALTTAAFGLGQIVGPSLAGLIHDRTGTFALPSFLAAGALIAAALLATLVGTGRTPAPAAPAAKTPGA